MCVGGGFSQIRSHILSSIRLVPRNKLLIIDIWTVLLEYIHNCLSMLTVLLEYIDSHTQGECSIRVYRSSICLLCWHYASIMELPIMPKIMLA